MARMDRYNLVVNPFRVVRLATFVPDKTVVPPLAVDGFNHLTSLDSFLKRRIDAKKPAFVLIRGPKGMGRTEAARYALGKYRFERGAKPEQFILPKVKLNADPLSVFQKWLGEVRTEIQVLDRDITVPTKRAIERLLSADKYNEKFQANFRAVLLSLDRQIGVGANPVVFGFCAEDPPERLNIAEKLQSLYKSANSVVVLVSVANTDAEVEVKEDPPRDSLLRQFKESAASDECWIFPRSNLTAADIIKLAEHFWAQANPGVKCPISKESIAEILNDSRHPLQDVLSILAAALDARSDSFGETKWPDPTLSVSSDDLRIARIAFEYASTIVSIRYRSQSDD